MLRTHVALLTAAGAVAAIAGLAVLPFTLRAQQATPQHQVPQSKDGNVVVMLCDGKTSLEIKGLKPGQRMSHDQATGVARKLMETWQREHPGEHWEMAQAQSPAPANPPSVMSPPPPSAPAKGEASAMQQIQGVPVHKQAQPQQQGDTYASFHQRDFQVWQAETQKFVEEGKRIFHSDKLLGGTIGVSCDMCHPDAANTHPGDLSEVPGPIAARSLAARHDRLVHRESGQGQDDGSQRSERYARWRPTSSRSARACRWITASTDSPLPNLEEHA